MQDSEEQIAKRVTAKLTDGCESCGHTAGHLLFTGKTFICPVIDCDCELEIRWMVDGDYAVSERVYVDKRED